MNHTAILINNGGRFCGQAPHLEHGEVSAKVDRVAARVCGVHRRTLANSHREKEDLVGAAVLRLVETLHGVEELLGVSNDKT